MDVSMMMMMMMIHNLSQNMHFAPRSYAGQTRLSLIFGCVIIVGIRLVLG